jgi:hypothetical protein
MLSYVTLFCCTVKQTTEVKPLPIPQDTISQQWPCHITAAAEANVTSGTIPFVNPDTKRLASRMVFSCYFPFSCQYPYTNATYFTMNTVDATWSQNASSLTKISVCFRLKNISLQVGVFVLRTFRTVIWFEYLYAVTLSGKKLVHNYTVRNFTQELRLLVLVKLVWNTVGGSGKIRIQIYYVNNKKRGCYGCTCTQR